MRPSKPSARSVSAALAPARPAPTITWVRDSATVASGQGKELLTGAGIVADEPVQRRGDRAGAGLLHPAQRHAEVLGLEHDADALRLELIAQPSGDLCRQSLLHLQVAREQLDDPRKLRQPDDAVARQVADVRDADERQQMVLAQRMERDLRG